MKRLIALALFSFIAGGCWTANAHLPGTLRKDVDDAQVQSVGRVELEKTHYYFIVGLVNAPPPNFLEDELRQQVKSKGGDGIRNLTYESQFGCLDLIITQLTLGCVAPRSYKVTGEVVKITAPAIPGKPVAGMTPRPVEDRVAQKF